MYGRSKLINGETICHVDRNDCNQESLWIASSFKFLLKIVALKIIKNYFLVKMLLKSLFNPANFSFSSHEYSVRNELKKSNIH